MTGTLLISQNQARQLDFLLKDGGCLEVNDASLGALYARRTRQGVHEEFIITESGTLRTMDQVREPIPLRVAR